MSPEDIKKIISEKVTGVWVAKHDATGHQYLNSKTGELVRSVTTIIGSILAKPHLIKWAAKMSVEWLLIEDRLEKLRDPATYNEILNGAILAHTDIRDSAGGIGTQAHNAIEKYIKEWI
ncbi:MAG: hypothetical protein U9R00_02315, partial [Patescibacteria group bacterium]|nr:hypothetical protein [Patescibacteria group bacterium]